LQRLADLIESRKPANGGDPAYPFASDTDSVLINA
jgi:hypothetical protein